jgi:serine/threonine-protein kinase
VLARHELLERLGRGGMGVVYRARDPVLDRVVALKLIRADLAEDPGWVERFYREARAAARLQHRHVMPIWGMGLHEGQHAFVMPVVAGGSLANRLADFQRDRRTAVVLMEKVARGVQALHEQGIVHRDLKPGNVLLDEQGEPLVADFGLAKFVDGSAEMTATGAVVGTPAYMSPEQAAGLGRQVTPACDVWALGVMLYELTTGRRPFLGDTQPEVARQVLAAEPPRPRRLRRDLPRDLETVVLRCLEKDPKRRYATAGELADDLERWLRGAPVRTRPRSLARRAWGAVVRHPTMSTAIPLVAVVLALLLWRGGRAPEREPKGEPKAEPPAQSPLRPLEGAASTGRWVFGTGKQAALAGGAVRLTSPPGKPRLFELLPRVPWERFRVTGNVEQTGKPAGQVGVYLQHAERSLDGMKEHWFCVLRFSEEPIRPPSQPGKRPRAVVRLDLVRYRLTGADIGLPVGGIAGSMDFISPRKGRRVRMEVTPETLRAYWENGTAPFCELIRATSLKEALQPLALWPPAWNSAPLPPIQGGLGLYCEGEAVFRDVLVEPLRESE